MDCLIRFVQQHEAFRRPEIEALALLADTDVEFDRYDENSPFSIVRFSNKDAACRVVARSISSKAIYELWGAGRTYAELHEDVRRRTELQWHRYGSCSFRFDFDTFQGSRSADAQKTLINSFSYLPFNGAIKMRDPDQAFCIFEEYKAKVNEPSIIYFGRLLGSSQRHILQTYTLKKRAYINTTSMDSELALLTANITLAAPHKIFYDPFVGTGSFPIACAHFGAHTIGSDIDGRTLRGRQAGKNIKGNFQQYELSHLWLDGFVADLTNTPLRLGRWLDGIVCDPPYGIREGLKVLGMKDDGTDRGKNVVYIDGIPSHLHEEYIPPKRAYSLDAMLADILHFAVRTLVDNGRLSIWIPTANETSKNEASTPNDTNDPSDQAIQPPTHEALEIVSLCTQTFNKWSRRLVTYRRRPGHFDTDSNSLIHEQYKGEVVGGGMSANELNGFRKRYFEGFR